MSSLAYSRHINLRDSDLEDDEGDSWHVLVGGEDVKVLSTDQLADLYRLSIVDDSTLLWQPGMGQWTSLAKVAGLEGDPAAVPQYPQHQYAQLPGEIAPVRFNSPAAHAPATQVAFPTAPPMAYTVTPPHRSRRAERWVFGLALAAALLVALYRTDALFSLAEAWHQTAAYSAAERSVLGGPAAQSPRALMAFIESHAPAASAALVIPEEWTGTSTSDTTSSLAPGASASARPASTASSGVGPGASGAASSRPTPPSPTAAAETAASPHATNPPATAPRTPAAAPPGNRTSGASRPTAAPARPRRRSSAGDAVIPGMKPGGNEYDPLNSKL